MGDDTKTSLPLMMKLKLFIGSFLFNRCIRSDGTINRRLLDPKIPPSPVSSSDISVDPSRGLWFRLFVPHDSPGSLPVIVFFHGGGFVYLSPDFKAYDDVCRRFARAVPAIIVSVNYRLAPEHPHPAQYDDGCDVLQFLEAERGRVLPDTADLSRCFLAGDSAGGNLAHHVALRTAQRAESPGGLLRVVGVIAIQPFFGGERVRKSEIELEGVDVVVNAARTQFMWKAFMPRADRDHEVINVCGPNAVDISNIRFPATMVVVAGFDSLKDWQMSYYNWLVESGKEAYLVNYPDMFHAFYIFPELPESTQLVSEVKNFIDKVSNST